MMVMLGSNVINSHSEPNVQNKALHRKVMVMLRSHFLLHVLKRITFN